ncbi:MAG: BON domain-containing protein [Planctomycetota bacterium]
MTTTTLVFDSPHADLAEELYRRVSGALAGSAHFRTQSVHCRVENTEDGDAVVLSGDVPSWHHKQLAQQAAMGALGRTGAFVRNRISVVAR